MPGGLMQLVGKGAQDVLLTGNPSFTHFRSMYKRHTDFAMEHFRLYFNYSNLSLPVQGNITLKTKVDRNAQLLHDCYLNVTIPDIYSPVVPFGTTGEAIGYEFQWIKNLGYNMINYVAVTINGSEIVRHTGEWMKLYAALKFDKAKKDIIDQMVGNVPELYDPANAYDRMNQYPHSISTATGVAAPSIPGRVLSIPLHFWFCELIGNALPLIALQHSEVAFIIELKNMYQLFTVRDTRSYSYLRIPANLRTTPISMARFLSPPTYGVTPRPSNNKLLLWNLNPYIEANYIFVTDSEMAHIATTDHSFLINQVSFRRVENQYSVGDDIELGMQNLCSRVVWVTQRTDRVRYNEWDNYTNWVDPQKPPLDAGTMINMTPWYSSGIVQLPGTALRDILISSNIVLDGKDRFTEKQYEFFDKIQNYRHHSGTAITQLPGIYSYSFALDHNTSQPSGSINGSQFNKTLLRNTYLLPPTSGNTKDSVVHLCVLKSTANNPKPTVVNPFEVDADGVLVYSRADLVHIIQKTAANTYNYTYAVNAYVESYNFLRVIGGIANLVFSS
jgi:hypothetical protein